MRTTETRLNELFLSSNGLNSGAVLITNSAKWNYNSVTTP
jgi:hypothetical protein